MTTFRSLVRSCTASGAVRYRLGDPLVDRYLKFVAGRARPNTLRATAFDLKTFFSVVAKDPLEVTPADVFEFLAEQRRDRTVVRISDGESGLSARTIARRLSSVSGFSDIPKKPEPLPRFLDDAEAAKFMAAAGASTDPRDRLVVELLARTGMRAGELADLEADAVVQIGGNHWLRIPLGKLRNDRYVPLHPQLVDLLGEWTAINVEHVRAHRRLVADHRGPLNRHTIDRIIHRVGRAAGVDGVHPHRLRHTLATQAINRGMRLEAIAALLGHKKM